MNTVVSTSVTPNRAARRAAARAANNNPRKAPRRRANDSLMRVKNASVGRIFIKFMDLMITDPRSQAMYGATLEAVYCYFMCRDYRPDSYVEANLCRDVYDAICLEIDRSEARSREARKRAAKRKAALLREAERLAALRELSQPTDVTCVADVVDVAAGPEVWSEPMPVPRDVGLRSDGAGG